MRLSARAFLAHVYLKRKGSGLGTICLTSGSSRLVQSSPVHSTPRNREKERESKKKTHLPTQRGKKNPPLPQQRQHKAHRTSSTPILPWNQRTRKPRRHNAISYSTPQRTYIGEPTPVRAQTAQTSLSPALAYPGQTKRTNKTNKQNGRRKNTRGILERKTR